MACECCGRTFVDEVALLAIEDAVIAFRDAVVEADVKVKGAWADAELKTVQALAAAGAA